jgi:ATP synthase protein I
MAEEQPPKGGADEELSSAAKQMRAAEPYISAVWKLVGGAVVGVLGGYWLDGWLGTRPWMMVALSLVGISVGFYAFLHAILHLPKR